MTLLDIVGCALPVSPWQVILGLYWRIRGRKVRARNILLATAVRNPLYYQSWIRKSEKAVIERFCAGTPAKPLSIVAVLFSKPTDTPGETERSISSLLGAFGDAITIYADGAAPAPCSPLPASLSALFEGIGDHCRVIAICAGDTVSQDMARAIGASATKASGSPILYWDDDSLDRNGLRSHPFLKPDWDDLLFLARDILTGSCAIRADAARAISTKLVGQPLSPEAFVELTIAMAAASLTGDLAPPRHIPLILSHRRDIGHFGDTQARRDAFAKHWPEPVDLSLSVSVPGLLEPRHPLPDVLPSISVIIPTRDRVELLRTCHDGLKRVNYAGPIQLIVVDNDSSDTDTLAYLEGMQADGATIIRHGGAFNFSTLNNLAAKAATGEFLCLMNNDLEMLDDDWLSAMVRQGIRPGVGAVGALLLYPDRTVQHAGVAIGVGSAAGHIFRGIAKDEPGHHWLHRITRRQSAVTAACLLLRKDAYFKVGGLDEDRFAVAFNDVDLCLKLRQAGLQNVYAADACLIHHESKSRGHDSAKENIERFRGELAALQETWGTATAVDPYHHPLLLRSSESYVLAP